MKQLKTGDLVRVDDDDKPTRIWIKPGKDGGAICVSIDYEENYKNGDYFETYFWLKGEWWHLDEKKIFPFEWDDRERLRDKWIKYIGTSNEYKINYFIKGVNIVIGLASGDCLDPDDLLDHYTFLDGSPCGKEI